MPGESTNGVRTIGDRIKLPPTDGARTTGELRTGDRTKSFFRGEKDALPEANARIA